MHDGKKRFQSSLLIQRLPLMLSLSMTAPFMSAMFTNTSHRANSPIATDQKLEAVHQLGIVEHKPGNPALVVDAHGGDRQTEQRRKQRLDQRTDPPGSSRR